MRHRHHNKTGRRQIQRGRLQQRCDHLNARIVQERKQLMKAKLTKSLLTRAPFGHQITLADGRVFIRSSLGKKPWQNLVNGRLLSIDECWAEIFTGNPDAVDGGV